MKKILYILVLFVPFLQLNSINSIHKINLFDTGSIAWAQESKKQPSADSVQPAPDVRIQKHPFRKLLLETPEEYVIGQGDVLEVLVWRNEQLSRQVVVRPDGQISLPLLQDLQAEGLTVLELKNEITRRFSEYVVNPRVTVIVSELTSYKVNVLGRVVTPGVYPITGKTTLVEAISMAGGFTEWANKRKITVITHQGGREKKIKVNYKKIISGKDPSQNIILQRGDTIIVP